MWFTNDYFNISRENLSIPAMPDQSSSNLVPACEIQLTAFCDNWQSIFVTINVQKNIDILLILKKHNFAIASVFIK